MQPKAAASLRIDFILAVDISLFRALMSFAARLMQQCMQLLLQRSVSSMSRVYRREDAPILAEISSNLILAIYGLDLVCMRFN